MSDLLISFSLGAQIFLVLNLVIWLWLYRSAPIEIRNIGPFLILATITEFLALYMAKRDIPNLFSLHLYTLLEFLAWSFFYKYLFRRKDFVQKYYRLFISIIAVLIILNTVFIEPIGGFNSNAKSLIQIILIISALYYFFNAFGKIDLNKSSTLSVAIINFGILLYYSGTLFIFMFSRFLNDNHVARFKQHGFWTMNALIYLIFLMLISISLWIIALQKKKSS